MTGSPLGDCVKALTHSEGDFEKAKEFLRKKGLAYAEKRADRLATQGLVGLHHDDRSVTMVQFSCETDFVANTERFRDGLVGIVDTIAGLDTEWQADQDTKELLSHKMLKSLDHDFPSQTIEEAVKFVVSKTQENCQLARVFKANYNAE